MGLNTKQRRIMARMGLAILITVSAGALPVVWSGFPVAPVDAGARITWWLAGDTLVVLWLLVATARIAKHRFFTPEDIDGGGLSAGSDRVKMLQAILQNTLEQVLFAVVTHGAWLFLAPAKWGALSLVAAALFACGRALFFIGYARGAPARALGFALTFYPTVGLFLASLSLVIMKLVS